MRTQIICLTVLFLGVPTVHGAERAIRFNRDVRPILTDKCFACHGPDARTVEADLRLDLRDFAIESGAIVPGDVSESEVVRRIFSDDEFEIMPPPEAHKPLTESERKTLRRWIAEGAEYEAHWAYTPLERDTNGVPAGPAAIDHFIDQRLAEEGVEPVAEADPITLIRRLSFDLTGIPPTPMEVDEFIENQSEDAYTQLVDRLLDSPRFGERMAIYWLDLVRYADTVGYHGDQNISQSPYRDYVIDAFNDNMPYDQFVREQLAGDLLPDPTIDQLVASGYNRLNQTTEEGGSQAKEYLAIYFADRVRNVSQVFMGATMGCAQCHDHKYDPYTARDFYSLGAFFADLEEVGVYGGRGHRPPVIRVPTPEQSRQIEQLNHQIEKLETQLIEMELAALDRQSQWEASILPKLDRKTEVEMIWVDDALDTGGKSSGDWNFVNKKNGPVHSGTKSRRQSATGLVQHFFDDATEKVTIEPKTKFFTWVHLDAENPPQALMLQINDGDWNQRAVWGGDEITYGRKSQSWAGYNRQGELPKSGEWSRLEIAASELGLKSGDTVKGMAFTQFGGLVHWDKSGWLSSTGIPANVAKALKIFSEQRSSEQSEAIKEYYLENADELIAKRQEIERLKQKRESVEQSATSTVVSKSVKPRTIRILPRGNWMDDSGQIVEPAIPEFLGQIETDNNRATRLDLANWICDPDNVLTSRTMVNRLWFLMFGRGISSSVDDLGGQGTFPSHPELLDWLAVEFIKSRWDVKHMLRTIALSEAYRRSSKPTPQLRERDPYNNLIARQGRYRIPAEMVRDSALSISGLLVEKVGGVSVKPYQPVGYYAQLNFPRRTYQADSGENQYRRGVYTHWQRTFLHPMLKAFDAPSREECTAQRSRSNTPLQALTLLNDPTFVEASCAFATRILTEAGPDRDGRIEWAYRTATSREPDPVIVGILRDLLTNHFKFYRENPSHAEKLVKASSSELPEGINDLELAAWTSVARVVLNLHESITRY